MEKFKVINPKIVIHRDTEKPYYEIEYYSIKNKDWRIGFGSYNLQKVKNWLKNYFEAIPADIVPLKHGKWIFGATNGISWMKCSECNVLQLGQTLTYCYCPNCGSKMDK